MSCYVIEKSDYERFAGCIAGIGIQKDYYRENVFYRVAFDGKGYHYWDADDFRKDILKLYDLNVKSVSKSWREKLDSDTNNYNNEFEEGLETATKLYKDAYCFNTKHLEFKKLIYKMIDFISSIYYQLDDDECRKEAESIIQYYEHNLLKLLKKMDLGYENLCWGDFELNNLQQTI